MSLSCLQMLFAFVETFTPQLRRTGGIMFEILLRTFGYNDVLYHCITLVTHDVEFDFLGNNIVIRKMVKLNFGYEITENNLQFVFNNLSKQVSELRCNNYFKVHI
jgi:hypothetical protein